MNTNNTNIKREVRGPKNTIRAYAYVKFLALAAAILFVAPKEADANCAGGRQVIVGQFPDVFFSAGTAATKEFTYTYKNVGPQSGWGTGDCGIYAGSTMEGVAVINTYGNQRHEAFPPELTGIGVSSNGTTWTLRIKARSDAPAGSGVINIYDRICDICWDNVYDPKNFILIGKVNVYVVSQPFATTFVATKPTDFPTASGFAAFGSTPSSFLINHPALNGNPGAGLVVTPNWNPGGTAGVYNDKATGVRLAYPGRPSPSTMWAIYDEDSGPMTSRASFNVRIGGGASFEHQAGPANITGNWTVVDNPITNGNPNAIILVAHKYSSGWIGAAHNHNLGVWYTGTRWAIFNQDGSAMPSGLYFTVLAFGYPGDGVFVHTANVANTRFNQTWIDNPMTNNNPNATILVTPNFNPGPLASTYVYPPIGVYYDSSSHKWAVFSQDLSVMPVGASFNVLIPLAPI